MNRFRYLILHLVENALDSEVGPLTCGSVVVGSKRTPSERTPDPEDFHSDEAKRAKVAESDGIS